MEKKELKKVDVTTAVAQDIRCAIALLQMCLTNPEIMTAVVSELEKARKSFLDEKRKKQVIN